MSPDQQRDAIEAACKRSGDVVLDEHWHDETDSVSGGSVDRVGLQAALREALSGVTDGVIVAKVNRFARTKRAGEEAIYELIEAGRSFIAVENGIDSAGGKLDRGGEVYLDFLLRQAQWEREDLQANFLDVRERHIAAGIANHAPYGYRRDEKTRRLVIVPADAKWVRHVFRVRATGRSWIAIADDLNSQGVAPPAPVPRKDGKPQQRATRWTHGHVHRMVDTRTYLGELRSGEFVNPDAHKPIITAELWEAAHAVRTTPAHRAATKGKAGVARPKRPRSTYLLTGMVRCGSCGGRMNGLVHKVPPTAKRKGYDLRYYICRTQQPWGRCERPARVKTDELDEIVLTLFEERWVSGASTAAARGESSEVTELHAEMLAAEADLRAFAASEATARMARTLGQQWFDEGIDTRTSAVEAARAAWNAARTSIVGARLPADLPKRWPKMSTEAKRALLAQVIAVVAVAAPPKNHRVPAAERSRLWWKGDAGRPVLPGDNGEVPRACPINID